MCVHGEKGFTLIEGMDYGHMRLDFDSSGEAEEGIKLVPGNCSMLEVPQPALQKTRRRHLHRL